MNPDMRIKRTHGRGATGWLLSAGLILATCLVGKGHAMGFLGDKVILFSKTQGVITLDAKPVQGARVTRTISYREKKYQDHATTATDGSFTLPDMPGPGRIIMSEFVGHQTIDVDLGGRHWQIWKGIKRDARANMELADRYTWKTGGIPIQFQCELSAKERYIKLLMSVLATRCQFNQDFGEVLEE